MKERINYSQCWEDITLVKKALRISADDFILSITSGGDNSIALLLEDPNRIVAVDMNPRQNFLAELKLLSAIHLPYEKYLELLGVTSSSRRVELFQIIKPRLSAQAAAWWTSNPRLIKPGLIHIGKFENYLNAFRILLLPWVHSQHQINLLLNQQTMTEQANYYHTVWNSWRWKTFFRLASSRQLLKTFARQEAMTNQNFAGTKNDYHLRLEKLILHVPLRRNYYMHYCLRGTYSDYLPPYLAMTGHKKLQSVQPNHLEFVTKNMLDYLQSVPANTFTKFNLSDAFESLSDKQNKMVWQEIVRVARNNAVIVYWNNQFTRKPPVSLAHQIISHTAKAKQLHDSDRVFFYKDFHINTINK